ncbi:MAG: hypothetical protein JWQ90_2184 [Hydrocarboniphaga sp.]|uniref:DUF6691 family protein n=1 Tax=Hydrocarboniphaga sp. TaxID=2033016 RepID=UPI0026105DE6|nr:DUF6691 family protein [Hydrocarboniphaga sp.]MDB5969734.1 hypothetical protein [Hydrocarboniphaga sp.]
MNLIIRGIALLAGLLFGAGMLVSGMADPKKVLSFLDVTRNWDPSLAFVMGSALAIAFPVFAWARRRQRTLVTDLPIALPAGSPITPQLVGGAALFGIGWGLSGLCPGPVLVVASGGSLGAIVFVAAMALGMMLSAWLAPRLFAAKPIERGSISA